ncbi:MAG: S1-like domain-containing RNA-binding protein [Thermodesulfobacteriota bacterium]|nr:S1-like domain-containing RNA-binding protein [Thermodesulfobacteriota bacterium]
MLEIGHVHKLVIDQINDSGALLRFGDELVLLPQREVARSMHVGQDLAVFVYRGRQDRLVATLKPPVAQVGEFALLRVSQANQYGAFLDWGLDKELLVPFAEQPERMRIDRHYIVRVCLDNSARLIGSARIERHLDAERIDLIVGQEVDLLLWKLTDLGAKMIIDNRYGGLLYRDELPHGIDRGVTMKGYVKRVREDYLIDVTLRKVGKAGREDSRQFLLEALQEQGMVPLTDKSSPEQIEALLGLSKKAFKRAVGALYKEGLIVLDAECIRLK